MNDKTEFEPLFPKEYDHLNIEYDELIKKLNAIDLELETFKKDKGPAYEFTPTWVKNGSDLFKHYERAKVLEKERGDLTKGFEKEKIETMRGLDEKAKQAVSDRFRFQTSRNPFIDANAFEKKASQKDAKEFNTSYEYVEADYFKKYKSDKIADTISDMNKWSDKFMDEINRIKGEHIAEQEPAIEDPEPEEPQ